MLTIKKDLYERVLKLCNVSYICDESGTKYIEVSTLPQKWDMLIPPSIQDTLGMRKESALTYIVNGEESRHHDTTDSNRGRLKEVMRGASSKHYEVMNSHVKDLIYKNAAINAYMITNHCFCSELFVGKIESFINENESLVRKYHLATIQQLSNTINELKTDIEDDTRISSDMQSYILEKAHTDPDTSLSILILLSLFSAKDSDKSFYTDFETHFINTNHITSQSTNIPISKSLLIGIVTELMASMNNSNTPGHKMDFEYFGDRGFAIHISN